MSVSAETVPAVAPQVIADAEGVPFVMKAGEEFLWKLMAEPAARTPDLAVVTTQPNSTGPPQHVHDAADELFYLLDGALRVQLDGVLSRVEAGSTVYVPRGTVHAWVNAGSEPARMLTLFLPGGMHGFFEAASPFLETDPPDLAALAAAIAPFNTRLAGPPLAAGLDGA